ncbi:hypothetical protein ACT17_31860 [Mycolicibacterium conceptionense]|jgi:hypothetical protein|uniref:Uncharacterized protein n=2 Tax=Mycolicibacterium TaxID=1866885 RepID=A0A0J8WM61_9MYCO|nr:MULTISPECIES: DUF6188 family protein [Mycolicibacterium]KLI04143.1 hypothetical protein AA982_31735 [Mycolicibacterium senegalense]KLO51387.1 hypothetical protein ABW05_07520 [Mycolicibacterium senegalense]KMV14094.1 hypothetical protein ACT17_31860 [Mycolicibacterium conceptionense]OBK08716.1 hypothetical protein A5639_12695 [Mycolicibacterium conceptionense]OMB79210.1 hypothetical protein A5741_28025 [Mycolicibacterium conceptionense]
MLTQWIECCTVQRVSLHDGLVLNLDDYNELVISGRLRLTLPPVGSYPSEGVMIDPTNVAQHERPLFDLAGSVCTEAWCADNGTLHLRFSRGHRIEVDADPHAPAWELYGKRHGYMACLPGGRVRTVRHDIPDETTSADIASRTS